MCSWNATEILPMIRVQYVKAPCFPIGFRRFVRSAGFRAQEVSGASSSDYLKDRGTWKPRVMNKLSAIMITYNPDEGTYDLAD